ncbi:MAG: hypothetical protein KKB31_04780, partial [Nanoarchaeota archaeon]|nr:hypothetical protein [Nanoarchaeota archaeon]
MIIIKLKKLTNDLLDFLFGKKQVEVKHIDIDPESVRKHHEIRALANDNAKLKGMIGKYQKDEGVRREREKDENTEEKVKLFLNEEKNILEKKDMPQFFSLSSFFKNYLTNKKFRDNLFLYSFDRSAKIAKFGDFGFSVSKNGHWNFSVLDENRNIVLESSRLKDIFQSVGALATDSISGKIPLNLDKEGGYIENIMVYEASELLHTEDGLKFAKARKKPVYDLLRNLGEENSRLMSDLEEAEAEITKKQNIIDDFKKANKMLEESS